MRVDYLVRELKRSDLKTDLNGFLISLQNMSDTGDISLERAKQILKIINSQNAHIYVAVTSKGKIIGTTTLLVEQKFIHNGGKVGHIEDVAVQKGYERNGIGSSLVRKALGAATTFGCYRGTLECDKKNIPFYEKLGFYRHEQGMRMDFNQE